MPKLIEYPRRSFDSAEQLAKAVDALGGDCTPESAAQKMGLNVTGSFKAIISAAIKHGWIERDNGKLRITDSFKTLKLAYDEDEKITLLRAAFLSAPLYSKLYEKFKGRELPLDVLPKMLVREFSVEEDMSDRIMGYFIEGATRVGLLQNNTVIDSGNGTIHTFEENQKMIPQLQSEAKASAVETIPTVIVASDEFIVQITGPGMNTRLTLADTDDFLILDAILKKLKKSTNKEGVKSNEIADA